MSKLYSIADMAKSLKCNKATIRRHATRLGIAPVVGTYPHNGPGRPATGDAPRWDGVGLDAIRKGVRGRCEG